MIVIDSTPLIYLNKVSLSWIFGEIKTIISESVYNEVVTEGKKRGDVDSFLAERLVKEGVIEVRKVKNSFKKNLENAGDLGKGEIETLCLAKEGNMIAIIDESIARSIGKIFNITVHGTFYLIFLMCKKGKLKKQEAKQKIEKMIELGWRVETEKYLEFVKLLKEFQ